MTEPIDFSSVIPLAQMQGDSDRDTQLLEKMADEAVRFLQGFAWCEEVTERYFGCGVGGVVAVFFFRILPKGKDVDEYLWVIIGDLPPAYLVSDQSRTPSDAMRNYVVEMREWVAAAEKGESVTELIPVNVPPTREAAQALGRRLDLLERAILRQDQ